MNNNPVVFSDIIKGILTAGLALVVAMGWVTLTDTQIAAWLVFITAVIALLSWYVQRRTIPTSQLSSDDGKPVTPASVRGGQRVNWNK